MTSHATTTKTDKPVLTRPEDSPYVEIFNPEGDASIVLICEHASNSIPEVFANPLADNKLLSEHIAWDPGARSLALNLSHLLNAPLVCSKVSRLIYDCNRPPESTSAIPEKSELFEIPGNHNLSELERQRRIDTIYTPFHAAVSSVIKNKQTIGIEPALVTIHSFTPKYLNLIRKTEIGILHDGDSRMADHMLCQAAQVCDLLVERNQPYGPEDGVTHTLRKHGIVHSLPNVMLEIKNDLLTTALEIKTMADIIQKMIVYSLAKMVMTP